MTFQSGVKGRGSDRWWERRWWLWWGDMRRMRWTRRTVNRMKLTEWRRELFSEIFSTRLLNATLSIRNIALNSATSSSIWISQKPSCGRLVIQRLVQQRRLLLRVRLCFSSSKHVRDNNAKRFLPSTHLSRIRSILYWTILIFIFLADGWRLTLTIATTGRHDGFCVVVDVLTARPCEYSISHAALCS